jgi:hypothetical protein
VNEDGQRREAAQAVDRVLSLRFPQAKQGTNGALAVPYQSQGV